MPHFSCQFDICSFFLEVAFQTFQGRPTSAAPHLSDRRLKSTRVLVALLMNPAIVANLQTFGEDGEEEKNFAHMK